MKILVGCECSQRVTAAFRELGHEAFSCDLKQGELNAAWHIQGDLLRVIEYGGWDILVAFPPCTYLSAAVSRLWHEPEREIHELRAVAFVRALMSVDIPYAIENPPGMISSAIRKPDQVIQPYWFGEPYSKRTCLWLSGLSRLKPTNIVAYSPGWTVAQSKDRQNRRSVTFQGVALAMAKQWSVAPLQTRLF